MVKASDTARVSPEGALVIPDTRQNAVTIMGTAEQIALAESLIPTLDAQLPQVAIEAALIEISETGVRELGTRVGISDGRMQAGFNNVSLAGQNSVTGLPVAVQPASTGLVGMPTVDATDGSAAARSGIVFSTEPLARNRDYAFQIRSLLTTNKAKILANPTVIATHDTESIISIVDEIVRRVTTQLDPSGFSTQTVEIGEAGIVLDILPRVGEDGTISMRLRPSVTTVLREEEDSFGNLITLLSKRDLLTQNVRIRDDETLVIGGLISETDTTRRDKFPVAGDLPIVGAMFRSAQKNGRRSELVLMITPHIVNKAKIVPVNASSPMPEDNNMHPVNLSGGVK
jgi:type II secretory pathway component GspD/PulD (secretin)